MLSTCSPKGEDGVTRYGDTASVATKDAPQEGYVQQKERLYQVEAVWLQNEPVYHLNKMREYRTSILHQVQDPKQASHSGIFLHDCAASLPSF